MKEKHEKYLIILFEDVQIIRGFQAIIDMSFLGQKGIFIEDNNNENCLKNLMNAKIKCFKCLQFLTQNYLENEQKQIVFPLIGSCLFTFLKEIIRKLIEFAGEFKNLSLILNGIVVSFFLLRISLNLLNFSKEK